MTDLNPALTVNLRSVAAADTDGNGWLIPGWVASVRSTAHRLTGDLQQARRQNPPPDGAACQTVDGAIKQALVHAQRSHLIVARGPFKGLRSMRRRIADWWTGGEVDQAWAELHTATQELPPACSA